MNALRYVLAPLTLFVAITSCVRNGEVPTPTAGPPSLSAAELRGVWEQARSFDSFIASPGVPQARWRERRAEAVVREDHEARAIVLPGNFRLLAIVEGDCEDCQATIPAVALLADRLPGLELRIISTSDASAAISRAGVLYGLVVPHVMILNDRSERVGCWSGAGPKTSDARGTAIMSMVVDRLEAAARGETICP